MTDSKSTFADGFNRAFSSARYMPDGARVSQTSICSVMLEMCRGTTLLGKGTGWFWRLPDGIALVTAWHNFSGLHHTLRTPLSRMGGTPDRIRFRYTALRPQTFQDGEIPLYLNDEETSPRWFVHPDCGSFFDMAFILIDMKGGDVACVNDTATVTGSALEPGEDVFAVGFPQGVRTMNVFPVWKRGSIASDPDVLVEGHPKFYLDIAGRGGLSGAPVYRIQRGMIMQKTGPKGDPTISFGTNLTEFVGLYSGRAADQLPPEARTGESTDLGFVWRAAVVQEMFSSRILDERPEVGKGELKITEVWGERRD